ncbi:DNA polymerase III subunit delta' [Candidatus Sororendozoicomonas aggregata]|uniref:DNA polymerase III subunit delta' n=1 Tax=Candidatus Sororendozoicomonas aggregata TaxID=3073239 RepID=UPI002ED0E93A
MALTPLPWQQSSWVSMTARVVQGTLAHAFLLKGAEGLGKWHFAKTFANWLLCESPGTDAGCGRCKNCLLYQADSHPDVLLVAPKEAGKPIKIAQIRALNDFARQTAQQGGQRIILINPAEAMNTSAANALLKCLEEPGDNTLFLLVSHQAGNMPATIRSRCQSVMFNLPAHEQVLPWLQAKLSTSDDTTALLLNVASGSPLQAVSLAEGNVIELRADLVKALGSLFRGELTPVELAKTWQNDHVLMLLLWLADWLSDVVKLSLTGDEAWVKNQDVLTLIRYLAKKTNARFVLTLRDELLEQRHTLASGGNLNVQLLLEGVFCRWLALAL